MKTQAPIAVSGAKPCIVKIHILEDAMKNWYALENPGGDAPLKKTSWSSLEGLSEEGEIQMEIFLQNNWTDVQLFLRQHKCDSKLYILNTYDVKLKGKEIEITALVSPQCSYIYGEFDSLTYGDLWKPDVRKNGIRIQFLESYKGVDNPLNIEEKLLLDKTSEMYSDMENLQQEMDRLKESFEPIQTRLEIVQSELQGDRLTQI